MTTREYKGWTIETMGGHGFIRRFSATRGDKYFWMFRLREVKDTIDLIEKDSTYYDDISPLYLRSLYG